MQSNMPAQKDFSRVPRIDGPPRSIFNRSHAHKTTFDVDRLIPIYIDEVLPGDSIDLKANLFGRIASPMQHPIMDNLHMDTFFFYVPLRLLWEHFEQFMGAVDDPLSTPPVYQIPQINVTSPATEGLEDYFGLPLQSAYNVSAMWHRAYKKVFNEWFRDENLQDMLPEIIGDGPDVNADYGIYLRNKKKDYYTGALPWAQKGDPVSLPFLMDSIPVIGNGTTLGLTGEPASGTNDYFGLFRDSSDIDAAVNAYGTAIGSNPTASTKPLTDYTLGVTEDPDNSGLIGDLTGVNAVLINDLRFALATQHVLEIDARGGTRFPELIKAHFNIVVPDFRVQRSEYLGGGSTMININPVTQTSQSDDTEGLYQGEQAAYATMEHQAGFSKSFVEHGVVIGLANVRADLTYQRGIPRMFSRLDRFDFYLPSFANLGEQAILNKEIFYQDDEVDEDVFGYQERWAELRFFQSKITGKFRSIDPQSLDIWHLSEEFGNLPTLNASFIQSAVPINRVLQVTTEPHIIMDSWFEIKHARALPVFSVPGLDRF